ncbi:hypothetical protein EC9_11250 [Rosistilla ulvae]|uniref:Zinc-finger domain-containing protein n=1 Tax=Rosistilla ulvae TaxID=1930277 RepID=A0A517LWE7_9BACT|nr:hypothetical protein [Rosistilla ulvae]QDS86950.1 hypothetical protein EC9_11250 [Rosistilla ulvae]
MKDDYIDRLIGAFLDDALSEAEQAEFETLMLHSEPARQRFWQLAEVSGLASQAALAAWPLDDPSPTAAASHPVHRRSESWSIASAITPPGKSTYVLVTGMLLGVLITGVAWPVTRLLQMPAETQLFREDFESGTAPGVNGPPTMPGRFSGDFSQVVADQPNVQAASGDRMLQMLRADYEAKSDPTGSHWGDLYRLIDLRSFHSQMAGGVTIATASAQFNSSPQPRDEGIRYLISMTAIDAQTAAKPQLLAGDLKNRNALAMAYQSWRLDIDPATWQQGNCEIKLPAEADFLLMHIAICHAGPEDLDSGHRITFAGHFIDDIQLSLTHYPR